MEFRCKRYNLLNLDIFKQYLNLLLLLHSCIQYLLCSSSSMWLRSPRLVVYKINMDTLLISIQVHSNVFLFFHQCSYYLKIVLIGHFNIDVWRKNMRWSMFKNSNRKKICCHQFPYFHILIWSTSTKKTKSTHTIQVLWASLL